MRAPAPDATTTWINEWRILDARWASIDVGGEVVLGAPSTLTHIAAARFAADGPVLWGHDVNPADGPNDRFNDFAVNASEPIVIGAREGLLGAVYRIPKLRALPLLAALTALTDRGRHRRRDNGRQHRRHDRVQRLGNRHPRRQGQGLRLRQSW